MEKQRWMIVRTKFPRVYKICKVTELRSCFAEIKDTPDKWIFLDASDNVVDTLSKEDSEIVNYDTFVLSPELV